MPQTLLIATILCLLGLAHVGLVVWANPPMIHGTFRVEDQPADHLITVHSTRDWWPFAWDDKRRRPTLSVRAEAHLTGVLWKEPLDVILQSDGSHAPREMWKSAHRVGLIRDADGRLMLRVGRCCVSTWALHPVPP